MINEEMYTEFSASFDAYVRTEDDQAITDTRRQMADKLLASASHARILELMEPHDLAVILSDGVLIRPEAEAFSHTDSFEEADALLVRQHQADRAPLAPRDGHATGPLLAFLLESPEGRERYIQLTSLLVRAVTQPKFRPFLHTRKGTTSAASDASDFSNPEGVVNNEDPARDGEEEETVHDQPE